MQRLAPTPALAQHRVANFSVSEQPYQRFSGNTLLIDLDLFPEMAGLERYMEAVRNCDNTIASLQAQIAALAPDALEEGTIEPYTKVVNGKEYQYHRYGCCIGRTKRGNPKLKWKHLSSTQVGEYCRRLERGRELSRLKGMLRQQQAIRQQLSERFLETMESVKQFCFQKKLIEVRGGAS